MFVLSAANIFAFCLCRPRALANSCELAIPLELEKSNGMCQSTVVIYEWRDVEIVTAMSRHAILLYRENKSAKELIQRFPSVAHMKEN